MRIFATSAFFFLSLFLVPWESAIWAADAKEPSSKQLLRYQVLLNSQFTDICSPRPRDDDKWTEDTRSDSRQQMIALVGFIEVSSQLIDIAVEHWASGIEVSKQDVEKAKQKLNKMYRRPGQRCYLMVLKIQEWGYFSYPERWKIVLPDMSDAVKLKSFSGKVGKVRRCEKHLDGKVIEGTSKKVYSCLLFIDDPVTGDDPTVRLYFSGIKWKYKGYSWTDCKSSTTVSVRFETGQVGLLQLIEKGIPWKKIERDIIGPREQLLASLLGKEASQFFLDVASGVLSGLLLKLL